MMRKFLMLLTVLSLAAVASAKSYTVTAFQQSIAGGVELQAGEYKLELNGIKVMLSNGKKSAEAEVKVETGDRKYNSTSVRYTDGGGNYRVREIRLGGAKTKLVAYRQVARQCVENLRR